MMLKENNQSPQMDIFPHIFNIKFETVLFLLYHSFQAINNDLF